MRADQPGARDCMWNRARERGIAANMEKQHQYQSGSEDFAHLVGLLKRSSEQKVGGWKEFAIKLKREPLTLGRSYIVQMKCLLIFLRKRGH